MSENVAGYRRALAALNRRDIEALIAESDPSLVLITQIQGVEGPIFGHAGVRTWWEDLSGAFADLQMELENVRDRGDWVIACGTIYAQGSESDLRLDAAFAHATEWQGGKCIRFESYRSLQEALEAAGLSE